MRNIGTYDNPQDNTYEQKWATLIESLMIADQLAHSTKLTGIDTSTNSLNACLCKPKKEVAAEMRDYILQTLKELVGQWADVYTAQFMQYNPQFKTTYGFPAGFGSVQNLSDHHFHFGYSPERRRNRPVQSRLARCVSAVLREAAQGCSELRSHRH